MAKELPYFKFEPNQWENGNIQMFSREEKGLFIDLCSMYWSRVGDLPLKLAIQKLCNGNATAFNSLIEEQIFIVKDGSICIDFLNEQLLEFENTSQQNSKNAKDRWEKYRKDKAECDRIATASVPQCENDAIREDKIIEKKIREDKSREDIKEIFNFKKSLIDFGFQENLVSEWMLVRKNKKATNTKTTFEKFIKEIELASEDKNEILKFIIEKDWKSFEYQWLVNLKNEFNKNQEKQNGQSRDSKSNEQIFTEAMQSEVGKNFRFQ